MPRKPDPTTPPQPVVNTAVQLTPTEILERGYEDYCASGGAAPCFIDVHRANKFQGATGPRLDRIAWTEFDEQAVAAQILTRDGPGTYTLLMKAAGVSGYIARVGGFELVGPSNQQGIGAGVPTPSPAPVPPAAPTGPTFADMMALMTQSNQQMMQIVTAALGANKGPSFAEIAALMGKGSSMMEQIQALTGLHSLSSKLAGSARRAPATAPDDDDGDGEGGSNIMAAGMKAFFEMIAKEKSAAPSRQTTASDLGARPQQPAQPPQIAAAPGQAPTPQTPPAAPADPAAPPSAPGDAAANNVHVPPGKAREAAAQIQQAALGQMLTAMHAGNVDPKEAAAAVEAMVDAIEIDFGGDTFTALEMLANNPDSARDYLAERIPALARTTWLAQLVTELAQLAKEGE